MCVFIFLEGRRLCRCTGALPSPLIGEAEAEMLSRKTKDSAAIHLLKNSVLVTLDTQVSQQVTKGLFLQKKISELP